MSSIKLFEDWARQSKNFKRTNESEFSYIDRSNRSQIAVIRTSLNLWFSFLPEKSKNDFKSRFNAEKNFDGVFYELFLYFLFRKLCFKVEIEPRLDGNKNKPDFLLTKNNNQIVVEATTNKYSLTSTIPNFKIRQQVIEELNKLDLADLRLLIYNLKLFVNRKPSIKKLKTLLITHCKQIDLSDRSKHSIMDSQNDIFTYEDEFLYFSTAFYYYKKDQTQVKKTIFSDSYEIGIDETIKQLNKSIKYKKSKYGSMEKPYIICVNFPHENLDNDEILSLMRPLDRHGRGIYCKSPGLSTLENLIDKSISAIFISFVTPYNISDPQFWFIKNPHANFPIENEKFTLDSYEYENKTFIFKPAQITISELLNLPFSPVSEFHHLNSRQEIKL